MKRCVDVLHQVQCDSKRICCVAEAFCGVNITFKGRVCFLSLQYGSPSFPDEGDDDDCIDVFVKALFDMLTNTPKIPKIWWSEVVVSNYYS
jgi:hypothetical protein